MSWSRMLVIVEALVRGSTLVTLVLMTAWASAAEAPTGTLDRQRGANPAKAKVASKAPSAPNGGDAAGYAVEPVPAWVRPLVADATTASPSSSSPVRVLLSDRQVRVDDRGVTRYFHLVRQINDVAGLQKGAQIEIDFDPSYERLVMHQLAVWRGAQRIDKLGAGAIKLLRRETQLERQVIDGRMTASIVLDDLRTGDRVEWAASVIGANPVFGGKFVLVDWTTAAIGPTDLYQLRLIAPAQRTIRHRTYEPAISVDSAETGSGWRETTFRRRSVPAFRYDEQLPNDEYLKDQIELSEFANWAEVSAWAEQLFAPPARPSELLESRAAEIRAQSASPSDQLRLALDFVQQDIRYFGTEIGANSHRPASAETVLRQRFGDCKDKVALLTALLGRLGYSATPVLVSTAFRDRSRDRLPSPLAFDHAIASVVVDGATLWLDGTRSQQSGPASERQSVGLGYGLLATSATSELTMLPPARDALRMESTHTFTFAKLADEGSLEVVNEYRGDLAEWIREAKAQLNASDFDKLVTTDTLRTYPGLTPVGAVTLESLSDRNAARATARFRTGDFWRFTEQRALVGDFALADLMSVLRLPDQNPRQQPLRLSPVGRYRHAVHFAFGEDVFAQPGNERFDETNRQFELHLRYDRQRNRQSIEGELVQNSDTLAPADWARYRDQLLKIWPRLASTLTVSVLPPSEAEALRAEIDALLTSMKRGKIKLATREQALARSRMIVLDRQLSSGRLPVKARAEALVALGIQLDHLGHIKQAEASLRQALALNPDSGDAHAALAVNAFARNRDDEAVEQANEALRLAPDTLSARYTRVWARFFSGNIEPARDELTDILKSRGEADRGYGAIWLYLTTRRLGGDGVAAIRPYAPSSDKPEWPIPVLDLMSGRIDFDAALRAARENGEPNPERECELYFYAAQKALLDSDAAKARTLLMRSLATEVVEFNEFTMARREFERLEGR